MIQYRSGQRGRSGAVGNNTANVTTRPGSNPGDPEAALASGSRPLHTRVMVPEKEKEICRGPLDEQKYVGGHWMKICWGPLDEQKIPRGGARVVQPGMPFPNLYRCNKVLVKQKKLVMTELEMTWV